MFHSAGTSQTQAFDLLAHFVDPPSTRPRRPWLPTAGTLPQFGHCLGDQPAAVSLTRALRSLGQVIVINNPISGLLLLLALHSVLTPEEHRQRFLTARSLLTDFRRQLQRAISGETQHLLMAQAGAAQRQELQSLFKELDRDGSGNLSVAEIATGLMQRQSVNRADATSRQRFLLLQSILKRMDLDGDGRADPEDFSELMLRLRRLKAGQSELLTYLQPADADGNAELDPAELDRLLVSVGQPRLGEQERQVVFGATSPGLRWGRFLDLMLLT